MLQALDNHSGIVVIPGLSTTMEREEWKKTRSFSCPACKQPVILKTGSKVTPHFAHKAEASCHLQEGGEGKYHAKGKLQLYQWLRNQNIAVELEAYLPGIKQRPDLLVTIGSKKIALEYQCAAISPETFGKRTKGYLDADITPIWILGGNRQKRAGIDSLQLSSKDTMFLHQYNSTFSPLLYYYCSDADKFSFFHHIFFTGRRKTYGKLHFSPLAGISFSWLFHPSFQWKQGTRLLIYPEWKEEMKRMRTKPPAFSNPVDRQWHRWLYEQQLHPSLLPSIIGLPVPSQFKLQHSSAVWQTGLLLQLIHPLPVGKVVTLGQSRQVISDSFFPADLFPLVQHDSCPVEEYFDLLVNIGILIKKSWFAYEKKGEVFFPSHLDQALQADKRLSDFLLRQGALDLKTGDGCAILEK